jgi:DnaJ-class molecular chaperone
MSRLIFLLFLILFPAVIRARHSNLNPYKILGVSPSASSEEIRKQYKKLCIKYHPDKGGDETLFKQVQQANSMIGTKQARQAYDNGSSNFFQNRFSQPGSTSSSFGTTGNSPYGFRPMFAAQQSPFGAAFSVHRKAVFVQTVSIPLQTLYRGDANAELRFRGSLWQRITAAVRSDMALVAVYQALLYALPFFRINRRVYLVAALFLWFRQLPAAPHDKVYFAHLKAGYKQGTKLTFTNNDAANVVFVLKEQADATFWRQGNDLHTKVHVERDQESATVVTFDGDELTVDLPGRCDGEQITIADQGWPLKTKGRGNLIVHVERIERGSWMSTWQKSWMSTLKHAMTT